MLWVAGWNVHQRLEADLAPAARKNKSYSSLHKTKQNKNEVGNNMKLVDRLIDFNPIFICLLFSIYLSGCGLTPYIAPTTGPLASLKFTSALTVPTRHNFVHPDNKCGPIGEVPDDKWVDIPTGKPLHVEQGVSFPGFSTYEYCGVSLQFTPEEGKSYVSQFSLVRNFLTSKSRYSCKMQLFMLNEDGTRKQIDARHLQPSCYVGNEQQMKK